MWKNHRLMGPDDAPAGGGTPAPAAPSAPASTPASSAPADSSSSTSSSTADRPGTVVDNFDFASLVDYSEGKDPPAVPQETPPVAPVAQASTPAAPPAAAPVAVPPQAVPAQAPTEQVAQPATTATAQPPASTEQPAQQINWEEHRKEFTTKLEKQYAMSEQEVQDFQTNPGQSIPKLAAQLHYNVTMALQAALKEYVPQMIGGEMRMQSLRTQHENTFYSQHPKLKEAVAKDIRAEASINQAINAVRTANPKATMEQVMQQAGLLAMITLGIDPTQGAAPAAPAPIIPQMIPGRPAGTGMQGHMAPRLTPGAPATDEDLYGGMADHFASGGG